MATTTTGTLNQSQSSSQATANVVGTVKSCVHTGGQDELDLGCLDQTESGGWNAFQYTAHRMDDSRKIDQELKDGEDACKRSTGKSQDQECHDEELRHFVSCTKFGWPTNQTQAFLSLLNSSEETKWPAIFLDSKEQSFLRTIHGLWIFISPKKDQVFVVQHGDESIGRFLYVFQSTRSINKSGTQLAFLGAGEQLFNNTNAFLSHNYPDMKDSRHLVFAFKLDGERSYDFLISTYAVTFTRPEYPPFSLPSFDTQNLCGSFSKASGQLRERDTMYLVRLSPTAQS